MEFPIIRPRVGCVPVLVPVGLLAGLGAVVGVVAAADHLRGRRHRQAALAPEFNHSLWGVSSPCRPGLGYFVAIMVTHQLGKLIMYWARNYYLPLVA